VFEYFPDNYSWSLSVMLALGMGGQIGEIDEICLALKPVAAADDDHGMERWFQSWRRMAERLERLGRQDLDAGHALSAGRKLMRAALYHLMAERHLTHLSPRKIPAYEDGIGLFGQAIRLLGEPVEFVEVPYEGTSLPALFLPAQAGSGPAPCIVHFDGLDVMKEMIYLMGASGLPRRGVSVLICDNPGVGGALRLKGLPTRFDTEVPAAACIDYLETRSDVDSERIGIMAISLGGYYAPRAAAFEKRFKCCVLWGAIWSLTPLLDQTWRRGLRSVSDFQLYWVFGTEDPDELARRMEKFDLEGVVQQIECPILIVHGENDRQAPVWTAHRTYDAATHSSKRELKIFTFDEGGAEHCQCDNGTLGVDFMHDWVADVLVVKPPSGAGV
jgi:dienelactone hydrolase